MSLFDTGIRPAIDAHLLKLSEEVRDYGDYWSASSAGYCYRRLIFERLKVPYVKEDARKQRVFAVGDIFHEWAQRITKDAGISIAQELELQDEDLMVRGHIDDLVLIPGEVVVQMEGTVNLSNQDGKFRPPQLILYDYKSVSSRAFSYQSKQPSQAEVRSYFHRLQLGTYMYMLNKSDGLALQSVQSKPRAHKPITQLSEARIMKISKDDLRMTEEQLLWSDELEKEVVGYWTKLNEIWKSKKVPPCTCHEHEGGFLAKQAYNPYFYNGLPCSVDWFNLKKKEG